MLFFFDVSHTPQKNDPHLLENASNLTLEVLYNNFNKKILLNILAKSCHTKTPVSQLTYFHGEMVHFFLKNEALSSESVKNEDQNYLPSSSNFNIFTSKCIFFEEK